MTIGDKATNEFVEGIFGSNMLQLFDLNGNFRILEHQRHVCSSLRDVPGKTKKEKMKNSILGALYLCEIWRIHLIKSFYPFPYYICVQLENDWLQNKRGEGTPPYVVLVTRDLVGRVKDNPLFTDAEGEIDINIRTALFVLSCQSSIQLILLPGHSAY
jgi:hypothetical protein